MDVLQGGVVSTSPNSQAGGPPLVGCPRLLIQFIRSYPPYRRPHPEEAPCRGDRDPLHMDTFYIILYYYKLKIYKFIRLQYDRIAKLNMVQASLHSTFLLNLFHCLSYASKDLIV